MSTPQSALSACGGFIRDRSFPCHILCEAIGEGVLILDRRGRILHCNARTARLLGKPRKDIIGRLARSFASAPERRRLDALLSLQKGSSEIGLKGPDGVVRTLCSVSPLMMRGAAGTCLVATDLTARDRELNLTQEASLLRQREAMHNEFVANVSHELRTPLAVIRGFTEALQRGAVDDPANRMDFLTSIESQAKRLTDMVENILEVSVLESDPTPPALRTVVLSPFIRDFMKNLEPLLKRQGITASVDIERGLAVRANETKLARVLQILCENAIKYNRKNGTLAVRAKLHAGRFALISVSDSGHGIATEDLLRIFDRFHHGKNRGEPLAGTGLGLAIAKSIVERHGGKIWARSVRGKGSTFCFTVPAARQLRGGRLRDG